MNLQEVQKEINLRNSRYWQKRFEYLEQVKFDDTEKVVKEIEKIVDKAIEQINEEIEKFYFKFAVDNEISLLEAKKILTKGELEEFKWSVEEYIEKGVENSIEQNWMKELKNASNRYRLSRLEAMKMRFENIISDMYAQELEKVDAHIESMITSGYYKSAYEIQKGLTIGFPVAVLSTDKIAALASKPWAPDGLNFSERIWNKHRPELVNFLENEFTQALVNGKNPKTLATKLAKKLNSTKAQAETLLLTESAFFYSAGQKNCFNALDVERYEIVATLDTRTSETCRDLDGKVFLMTEYDVGSTAPPFHPRCRTVTAPYFEDDVATAKRFYRDANGKVGYVPATMKYREWYEKYVK